MENDLQAIKDAYEAEDWDEARTLSDAYVSANTDAFNDQRTMSVDQCVALIDTYRTLGMETNLWVMEAWLLHHFEPQDIGGTYQPAVRE